jgi:hypothetical protein
VTLVERLTATVDPAEAEGAVEHLRVAYARHTGALLGDL